NASRSKPYDHVFADPDLRPYQVPTVIGENVFHAGLVLDSRTYTPLSDIAPAKYGDSGASNVQHMGVVKDFEVPVHSRAQGAGGGVRAFSACSCRPAHPVS